MLPAALEFERGFGNIITMKKFVLLSALCAGSLWAMHPGMTDERGYPVIVPSVQKLSPAPGAFTLPAELTVSGNLVFDLTPLEKTYAAEVEGGRVTRVETKGVVRFVLSETGTPESPEGYRLVVSSQGIRVTARKAAGLYYGQQTLGWMLRNRAGSVLKCCTIDDWPDLALRGAFLELNGVPPEKMARQCQVLEGLAALKYNVILCDFADNLPFTFAADFKRGKTFSPEDITAFVETAKRCRLKIVPKLQVLSHALWLTRHKDWASFSEGKSNNNWNSGYCPQNPDAQRVVEAVVHETCDLLKPTLFHLGLDEQKGCPHQVCEKCKDKKWADLVVGHVKPIADALLARGIRPIVYHDEFTRNNPVRGYHDLDEVLERLGPKTIVNLWLYDAHPSAAQYRDVVSRGHKGFFMSWNANIDNVMNLPRLAHEVGSPGCILAWWLSIDAPMTWTQTPSAPVAAVLQAIYSWKASETDYNLLPYDPMIAFRQVLASRPDARLTGKRTPVSLGGAVTAVVGGGDGRFPVLDKAVVKRIVRDAAAEGFRLMTAQGGTRLAAVALAGEETEAKLPKEAEIPFAGKAEGFSFLTAAAPFSTFNLGGGLPTLARIRVSYADGKTENVSFDNKRTIVAWNNTLGGLKTRQVSRVNDALGQTVELCAFDWKNPRPDAEITALTFASTCHKGAVPVLFGLVATGADLQKPAARPAAKPVDLTAVAGAPFEKLYDFTAHLDLKGLGTLVNQPKAGGGFKGLTGGRRVVKDAEKGDVLEIVVPRDPEGRSHRITVHFPLASTQDFATVRLALYCDHPEAISRTDMYVHGKGWDAAIGVVPSLDPGWTELTLPRSRFSGKESGGAIPGRYSDFNVSFFLTPGEETTLRYTAPEVTMRSEACRIIQRKRVE